MGKMPACSSFVKSGSAAFSVRIKGESMHTLDVTDEKFNYCAWRRRYRDDKRLSTKLQKRKPCCVRRT
jgi:hypothetical protein